MTNAMKNLGASFIGLVVGAIITGMIMLISAPSMMLTTHESKLGFNETVEAITSAVEEDGEWKIPITHDLQKSLVTAGHEDMTKIKVIELCHPDYAYEVLKNDVDKRVSAIMPCRIGIYEDSAGKVFISEMNTSLVSKIFGGNIKKVMGSVAEEQFEFIKNIIKN